MTAVNFNRVTGALLVEADMANINGDPDRGGAPRTMLTREGLEYGLVSDVSIKRKARDLVLDKEGPFWTTLISTVADIEPAQMEILEDRDLNRAVALKQANSERDKFLSRFWDVRLMGTTFLEKADEGNGCIKTGVLQIDWGKSIAPVEIEEATNTKMLPVQEGKDKGMAPLNYKVVTHALYWIPFFINPQLALKTGCTAMDVKIFMQTVPYLYSLTTSRIRAGISLRNAWWIEHKSPLGSCGDHHLLDALRPRKTGGQEPSLGMDSYEVPSRLPQELQKRVTSCEDLMVTGFLA